MPLRVRVCLVLVLVGSAGCGAAAPRPGAEPAPPEAFVTSNVARVDYVGSAECTPCHAEIAQRFERSPMHRMTRDARTAEIRAPFDGGTFQFRGASVTFERRGDFRFFVVQAADAGQGPAVYRVTKVIGGRYREDFVGQRVAEVSAEPRDLGPPREVILPATWHFRHGEWRYKGYSVQIPERDHLAVGPDWAKTCIFCHNTIPYLSTVLDDLGHYAKLSYQGSVPSNLFPPERQLDYRILDAPALATTLRAELAVLGAPEPVADLAPEKLVGFALVATRDRFDEHDVVELGIGCESCHNGARAHARDPRVHPDFAPRSPSIAVTHSDGSAVGAIEAQNRVCGRCHTVLLSEYDHTWEGGFRKSDQGGSTVNSSEARDFMLGGCARQMACTRCHDPHGEDAPARLAALATPAGNPTCTACHAALASPDALRAHAHHDPAGAGGSCIACHMPQKNTGLDYELGRYHRIGLPDDPTRVERDRPLECALCHRDATVAALVSQMERWWGRHYDRARLADLYGADLNVPVLVTTLARGLPHERATAVGALGQSGERAQAAALVDAFADTLPLTRYLAREALGKLVGVLPPVDMSLPGAALREAVRAWLATQTPR